MRRRDYRQKRNGDEREWCDHRYRWRVRLGRRSGHGRYCKRAMARRRRRVAQRDDD